MEIRIPTKLQVGGMEVNIVYEELINYGNTCGECSVGGGYIKLAKNIGAGAQSETSQQNTFVHELVHCILDTMGKPDLSADEQFVCSFASFLLEAVKSMEFTE